MECQKVGMREEREGRFNGIQKMPHLSVYKPIAIDIEFAMHKSDHRRVKLKLQVIHLHMDMHNSSY
jgi:hypothetical protein